MGYSTPSGGSHYERTYDGTISAGASYTPVNGLVQYGTESTAANEIKPQIYNGTTWIDAIYFTTNLDYSHWYNVLFVSNNGNFRIYAANAKKVVVMRWY